MLLLLLLSHFSHVRLCATPYTAATRLPRPRDSPGKNTGVGCHFLLQCMKVESLSHVRLFATPWTAAHQAPPPTGSSRQVCWSGVPSPSPFPSMIFLKVLNSRVEFPARLSVSLCPANHRHRVGQRVIFGVHPVQSDSVDTLGLG